MSKNFSKKKFEDLNNIKKDHTSNEAKKQQLELRDCTFKPAIDKKSEKLAQINRGFSSNKSYETLYNKHTAKMEKVRKLVLDKEQAEVQECTFAPTLVAKQKFGKRGTENADSDRDNGVMPSNESVVRNSNVIDYGTNNLPDNAAKRL
jgi:hypothetical protein